MQLLQNVQSRITEAPLPTEEEKAALYAYDPNAAKEGEVLIIPTDLSLSARHTDENQGILFSNRTEYDLDGAELLEKPYPLAHTSMGSEEEPLVLIIHTHGTEGFAKEGAQAQSEHTSTRSTDIRENIVSVGAVLAATLRKAGIGVVHCETMFDKDSYNDSYVASLAYVKEMLAAHPSITYVLDVHRDALESGDGAIMRPVTYIGNSVAAQVMLVVGTDAGGGNHPDWEKHLTIAAHLQKRLNDAYPALARPINVRDATFNAQYAKGSLLIEIGASGNSLREAENAAYYLGLQLADLICDNVSS
jgi:stage II sporulation protein P